MIAVRGPHPVARLSRGCVLTVGNYDGVHLGHQQMIGVLKMRAEQLRLPSTVLVFEPSSKEFIDPDGAPPRLTRWREKYLALAQLGVERLVTLRFDERMRAMTPQGFVDELIVGELGARHMVVGDDFRYGCKAAGTIDTLSAAGRARGFGVEQIPPYAYIPFGGGFFQRDGRRLARIVRRRDAAGHGAEAAGVCAGEALVHAGQPGRLYNDVRNRSRCR